MVGFGAAAFDGIDCAVRGSADVGYDVSDFEVVEHAVSSLESVATQAVVELARCRVERLELRATLVTQACGDQKQSQLTVFEHVDPGLAPM